MGTAENVLVGATGKIYAGNVDTALPTTSSDALDGDFVDRGYISDAGVVQAIGQDRTTIKAWGGDEVRDIRTSHTVGYKFVMLESNDESLVTYYGPQDDPSAVVEIKNQQGLRTTWVIDVVDGDDVVRIAIPDGEITELEDVTYATEGAISYGVTIKCYPDDTGVKAYKYVLDAATGS